MITLSLHHIEQNKTVVEFAPEWRDRAGGYWPHLGICAMDYPAIKAHFGLVHWRKSAGTQMIRVEVQHGVTWEEAEGLCEEAQEGICAMMQYLMRQRAASRAIAEAEAGQ